MMENKRKRGLGRGLSALIGNEPIVAPQAEQETVVAEKQEVKEPEIREVIKEVIKEVEVVKEVEVIKEGVQMMDIYQVEPDRSQPRQNFDDEKLDELTESIKQYGVLQPLIVQKKDGFYQIIAGERRWRAARNAGLDKVPVIIKEYNSEETLAISLIENIQREDLSPIEEALAYKRLMEDHQLKQEEVAEKVGKSRSAIANFLRLLNLDETVQGMVADGKISAGHAKVLLGVDSKEKQKKLAQLTIEQELSVRQLEKMVQAVKKPKKEDETDPVEALIYQSIGQKMQDILGTKVNIIQGKRKGKIEIEYYSPDDLERILDMMNQIGQQ